jgi:uncharacterized membrane protein
MTTIDLDGSKTINLEETTTCDVKVIKMETFASTDLGDDAEESETPKKNSKQKAANLNPNCLQVCCYGCCREELQRERKNGCIECMKCTISCFACCTPHFLKTVGVLAVIFVGLYAIPWVIGSALFPHTTANCWKWESGRCTGSFFIGMIFFYFVIVPGILFIYCGIRLLISGNNYDEAKRKHNENHKSDYDTYREESTGVCNDCCSGEAYWIDALWYGERKHVFRFSLVMLMIFAPIFIGVLAGPTLSYNHYDQCGLFKGVDVRYFFGGHWGDTPSEIDPIVTDRAYEQGICSIYVCGSYDIYLEWQPHECVTESEIMEQRKQCENGVLFDTRLHCQMLGVVTFWFGIYGVYVFALIVYGLVKLTILICKKITNVYKNWKKDLEQQLKEKAIEGDVESTVTEVTTNDFNETCVDTTIESQMLNSQVTLVTVK